MLNPSENEDVVLTIIKLVKLWWWCEELSDSEIRIFPEALGWSFVNSFLRRSLKILYSLSLTI